MTNRKKTPDSWEREFDEKFDWLFKRPIYFVGTFGETNRLNVDMTVNDIKSFIHSLLKQERQRVVGEIRKGMADEIKFLLDDCIGNAWHDICLVEVIKSRIDRIT